VSRAFIKETDDRPEELLERPVSAHSNLVTPGLASIEEHLAAAAAAAEAAQSAGDDAAHARTARDVRYWQLRRHTARLMPEPKADGTIQFGHAVTIRRGDGRQQTFRIVGEDEADPRGAEFPMVHPLPVLCSKAGWVIRCGSIRGQIIKVK
jgi:transcription elongation GreA/GreB family factor